MAKKSFPVVLSSDEKKARLATIKQIDAQVAEGSTLGKALKDADMTTGQYYYLKKSTEGRKEKVSKKAKKAAKKASKKNYTRKAEPQMEIREIALPKGKTLLVITDDQTTISNVIETFNKG